MATKRFINGASLLARGWRLLKSENDLWLWVSIPLLIDLVILFLGWSQGLIFLKSLLTGIISGWSLQGWLFDLLYYPMLLILGLGFAVVWLLAVVAVAAVVAGPFNALLAEKALQRQGIATVNSKNAAQWMRHAVRMFGISLLKATIFLIVGVLLFFVSFIPGLNLVVAYLSICLFAMDVFDYSFEARGFSLKQRLAYYRQVKVEIFGLGATLSLTSLLPGLTLLALPVAVVGITTLIAEREKRVQNGAHPR